MSFRWLSIRKNWFITYVVTVYFQFVLFSQHGNFCYHIIRVAPYSVTLPELYDNNAKASSEDLGPNDTI